MTLEHLSSAIEGAESMPHTFLEKLSDSVIDPRMERAFYELSAPKRAQALTAMRYSKDIPGALNGIRAAYAPAAEELRSRLHLLTVEGAAENVEQMIDAFLTPIDPLGAEKTRYIRTSQKKGETVWFGVDFKTISDDRETLHTFMKTAPQLGPALQAFDTALEQYEKQDPRYLLVENDRRLAGNKVDTEIFKQGQVWLQIVGVLGTLATGFAAWRTKKGYLAPMLFAALTVGASPRMRTALFAGKAEKTLIGMNKALGDDVFQEHVLNAHNIKGDRWAAHAEYLMDDATQAYEMYKTINENGMANAEDAINAYITHTMGNGTAEGAIMKEMILNGAYREFLGHIATVSDEDAKEGVSAFIRYGASSMKKKAEELDKHPPIDPGYPGVPER